MGTELPTLHEFLQSNCGWTTALAGALVSLTLAAGALLNPARTSLGQLHAEGIGMAAEPAAAARFYGRGCELGDRKSCDLAEAVSR